MSKFPLALAAIALTAAMILPTSGRAQPPSTAQVGVLNCRLNPSIGLIVVAQQTMECRFAPAGPYPGENYSGVFDTVGLDIGFTAGGVMGWAVFSPTAGLPRGGLAGTYVGASGDVGVGVGVGANVLFGGSNRTISLQPVSIEGTTSLNLALGASGLQLRPVP